jgi:uncharacterized protein
MHIFKRSLFILMLFALPAAAQETNAKLPPSIRTNGEATVTAKPDRAEIDIGVVTQAETSAAAASQNAEALEATLKQLRGLLGSNADIKTISYNITPNYNYPTEGGEPTITGYTATNVVRVTLDDLTLVGRVIDTAAASGANRIRNLQFTLKDERTAQAEALRQAAVKARQKAETLAAALGLKIVRIIAVTEDSPGFVPVRDTSYIRTEAASTPIETGTIEVRANVTLTVEVNP